MDIFEVEQKERVSREEVAARLRADVGAGGRSAVKAFGARFPPGRRNDSSRIPRVSTARRTSRSASKGLLIFASRRLISEAVWLLPSSVAPWR